MGPSLRGNGCCSLGSSALQKMTEFLSRLTLLATSILSSAGFARAQPSNCLARDAQIICALLGESKNADLDDTTLPYVPGSPILGLAELKVSAPQEDGPWASNVDAKLSQAIELARREVKTACAANRLSSNDLLDSWSDPNYSISHYGAGQERVAVIRVKIWGKCYDRDSRK